jgi:hypothetical protein
MKPLADGSVRFTLKGGKHHGKVVRLYPDKDGWNDFHWDGEQYLHPEHQSPTKPFLEALTEPTVQSPATKRY